MRQRFLLNGVVYIDDTILISCLHIANSSLVGISTEVILFLASVRKIHPFKEV